MTIFVTYGRAERQISTAAINHPPRQNMKIKLAVTIGTGAEAAIALLDTNESVFFTLLLMYALQIEWRTRHPMLTYRVGSLIDPSWISELSRTTTTLTTHVRPAVRLLSGPPSLSNIQVFHYWALTPSTSDLFLHTNPPTHTQKRVRTSVLYNKI